MARAIDADVLLKRLDDLVDWCRDIRKIGLEQAMYIIQEMPTLTPPNEPKGDGLYGKYTVYKNKDGSLVTDCFILRPAKDPAAVAALRAYATTTDNAELAADIINWVGAEPNEPLTLEQMREMEGELVWVKCLKPNKYINPPVRWRILEKSIIGTFGVWEGESCLSERDYGTDWLAYRRPPEGESDETE